MRFSILYARRLDARRVMLQHILLILAGFFIGLSYPIGIEPLFFSPYLSVTVTIALTAIYLIVGYYFSAHHLKRLSFIYSFPSNLQKEISKKLTEETFYRHLILYRLFLLVIYGIEVYLFHYPLLIIHSLGLSNIIFVTDLLILLPFLVTYILSWLPFYQIDRFTRGSTWSLLEYLFFQLRSHFLVILLPLLVFMLYIDLIHHSTYLLSIIAVYPFMGWLLALGMVLIMFLLAPFFLRWLWGTRSLPKGPLRERLEKLTQQAGIGIRDFLIWRIGRGRMANAMIIGLFSRWRYIIFTETLLNNLSEEEIEAVTGHELGHAKYHHITFYFLCSLGYTFMAISIEEVSRAIFGKIELLVSFNIFLMMILYWGVVFSKFSRELEMQADLYGAVITNNFESFISALQKIAAINAQPLSARSLQHPSVFRRIQSLIDFSTYQEPLQIFNQKLSKRLQLFFIFFLLLLGSMLWTVKQEILRAPQIKAEFSRKMQAVELAEKAYRLFKNKKLDEAIQLFGQAILLDRNEPSYYLYLGDAFIQIDGYLSDRARQAFLEAWKCRPKDPLIRIYLYERLKTSQFE